MLREIKWVSQVEGEPLRRWFVDSGLDLLVWQEDRCVVGFQLCYDKTRRERALSWQPTEGFRHCLIDDGEARPGRPRPAPALVPCGCLDVQPIARSFLAKSRALEREITEFVYGKLLEYQQACLKAAHHTVYRRLPTA